MARVSKVDWTAVQAEYRTGQSSNVTLASKFGITETAIRQRAKKEKWVKDLVAAVRKGTEDRIVRETAKVRGIRASASDDEVVEATVAGNAQVVLRHQDLAERGMDILQLLKEQLDVAARNRQLLEGIVLANTDPKAHAARAAMISCVSIPKQAATLRDLSTAMKNFVAVERQAHNIGEREEDGGIEGWLKKLAEEDARAAA